MEKNELRYWVKTIKVAFVHDLKSRVLFGHITFKLTVPTGCGLTHNNYVRVFIMM